MSDAGGLGCADVERAQGTARLYHWKVVLVLSVVVAVFLAARVLAESQVELKVDARDESGAVIPGARIIVTKVLENQSVTGETDSAGTVSFHLTAGLYELSVSMNGFKTATKQVDLKDTGEQTVAIVLRVGGCPIPDPCPVVLEKESQPPTRANKAPAVPDETTAVNVAEKALTKLYGKDKVLSERPFKASLADGIWHVAGTLYCRNKQGNWVTGACLGGVATANVRQRDGRVLKTAHTK